jgi:hypothetical protein
MIDQAILAAAIEGLEMQKSRLDEQITMVRKMIGGGAKRGPKPKAAKATEEPVARKKARKKRVMSSEARERIAAAQKKRWAAYHAAA